MYAFLYKMTHDTGFAPNTQNNVLTLATCKPKIRKTAQCGDWVFGFGSKTLGASTDGKLIYAAQITDVLPMAVYGSHHFFQYKIPSAQNPVGDNIYYCQNGIWQQRPYSPHTLEDMAHDLSGQNVLISKKFLYFGCKPADCPSFIHERPCRGHKKIECKESKVEAWFSSFGKTNNPSCQQLTFCTFSCGCK